MLTRSATTAGCTLARSLDLQLHQRLAILVARAGHGLDHAVAHQRQKLVRVAFAGSNIDTVAANRVELISYPAGDFRLPTRPRSKFRLAVAIVRKLSERLRPGGIKLAREVVRNRGITPRDFLGRTWRES